MAVLTTPDRRHRARLRRGRRIWNLMSRAHDHGAMSRFGDPLYDLVLEHLDPRPGQSVLDIGCGAGQMLARLRDAVGPTGRVVGVDYNPRMLGRSRQRIQERGWTDVELRQADASRTALGCQEFDLAVALSSFTAMPDIRTAVDNAYQALRPGGRLFVYDVRLLPAGNIAKRLLIRLLRLIYRATAGFTGTDVVAELRRGFDTVEPVLPEGKIGTTLTFLVATRAAGPTASQP